MPKEVSQELMRHLLKYQKAEVTGSILYEKIAKRTKDPKEKMTLCKIAADERKHAAMFKSYTKRDVAPNRLKIFIYSILNVLFGYTFTIKLMEKGENIGAEGYRLLQEEIPEISEVIFDEESHESILFEMLDEERLHYVGSMVLGLNDALVELTGTIAGLTFALANTRIVALSGIITGVSATLSMAASNYLAERANDNKNALKSSIYTGVAYLFTVVLMVLPYLLFPTHMYKGAFAVMITVVILIILVFNYYISVAKSLNFGKRFFEMAAISLSVALISFIIGLLAKKLIGIDI